MQVVAGVVKHEGKILACRNSPNRSHAGFWEFPGGKVESGESHEEALRRELREELEIEVQIIGLTSTIDFQLPLKGRIFFYEAELQSSPPSFSKDHDELLWLSFAELSALNWAPADQAFVTTLMTQ